MFIPCQVCRPRLALESWADWGIAKCGTDFSQFYVMAECIQSPFLNLPRLKPFNCLYLWIFQKHRKEHFPIERQRTDKADC